MSHIHVSASGDPDRRPKSPEVRPAMPQTRKSLSAAVLLAGVLLATGCKNVEPWQRRTLSDATMRGDRDPAGQGLADHMWFSREAASGGRGVGGGGCGCN
jgi:hypothetical protein